MGLGASGFPLDLPSPGLMPLPDASQAPHEHAAAPAGVASRHILAACLMLAYALIVASAHAVICRCVEEILTCNARK